MNRNYIDMHLVVDRYLRGSLSEEETAEFEERLVWDQHLMDELDLADSLREGMRRALEKNEVSGESGMARFTDNIREFFAAPVYAAAASFLVAVGLTSTALLGPLTITDTSTDSQYVSTEILPLFATRSDDVPEIRVNESSWTVLLVDAPPAYADYRVTVRREGTEGEQVWVSDDLAPTYPDSLAVGMPGELLPAGQYVLVLEGRDAGAGLEHIQDIFFRSVPAE